MDVVASKAGEFLELLHRQAADGNSSSSSSSLNHYGSNSSSYRSSSCTVVIEDMQLQYYHLTMDTICKIAFGVDLGCIR